MKSAGLENANPIETIGQLQIFELIRGIKDPEHPNSLEELEVIAEDAVEVDNKHSYVRVTFTPTVNHCRMAYFIGLCLWVKLMRSLPPLYKVDVRVAPGHGNEAAVNEELNNEERVAAASNDPALIDRVDKCLDPLCSNATSYLSTSILLLRLINC